MSPEASDKWAQGRSALRPVGASGGTPGNGRGLIQVKWMGRPLKAPQAALSPSNNESTAR